MSELLSLMRYFNSTKVQFGEDPNLSKRELFYHFNSTKVQFGAVKLDRKYHINKGFEKRFRWDNEEKISSMCNPMKRAEDRQED